MDPDVIEDLPKFGAALERARVILYAIHLDAMATTAYFGGGTAIRALSRATPAIRQIDTELSGTYLLGIERQPSDVAGRSLELKVEVSRNGSDVRTRQNVTISR